MCGTWLREVGTCLREGGTRRETDNGFDFIRVELSGGGVALQVGSYEDVRNRERYPASPGMQVISNGLGCGDEHGQFVVDRIERANGKLVAFDAGFIQSCGAADKPALRGRVHFQA